MDIYQRFKRYSEYILYIAGPIGFIIAISADYLQGQVLLNNWFVDNCTILACVLHIILIILAFETSDYKFSRYPDINKWFQLRLLPAWRHIWMTWGIQYIFILLLELVRKNSIIFVLYNNDIKFYLNGAVIFLNFWSGLMFLNLYYHYKNIEYVRLSYIYYYSLNLLFILLIYIFIFCFKIKSPSIVTLSSIYLSFCMGCLFGKLDSYYISRNILIVICLFLYATIQFGLSDIINDTNRIKPIITYIVFSFKVLFYYFSIHIITENELIQYYTSRK